MERTEGRNAALSRTTGEHKAKEHKAQGI